MKKKLSNMLFGIGLALVFLGYFLPINTGYQIFTIISFYKSMNRSDVFLGIIGIVICGFGIIVSISPSLKATKHYRLIQIIALLGSMGATFSNGIILLLYSYGFGSGSLPFWVTLTGYIISFAGLYFTSISHWALQVWNDLLKDISERHKSYL